MAGVRNVSGMRDFFGKKLGGWVYGALAHASPIDLAAGETAAKIATAHSSGGMLSAGGEIFSAIRNGIKNRGDYSIGSWFSGMNIGEAAGSLSDSVRRNRMLVRVGIPAMLGATSLSSFISPGNPIETVGKTGLQAGLMMATTAGIGQVSPGLAAAYAGWGGLNLFRSGDNFGPF